MIMKCFNAFSWLYGHLNFFLSSQVFLDHSSPSNVIHIRYLIRSYLETFVMNWGESALIRVSYTELSYYNMGYFFSGLKMYVTRDMHLWHYNRSYSGSPLMNTNWSFFCISVFFSSLIAPIHRFFSSLDSFPPPPLNKLAPFGKGCWPYSFLNNHPPSLPNSWYIFYL